MVSKMVSKQSLELIQKSLQELLFRIYGLKIDVDAMLSEKKEDFKISEKLLNKLIDTASIKLIE